MTLLPAPTRPTRTVPASLAPIAGAVEEALAELLTTERARRQAVDPVFAEPLDILGRSLLGGGKRLRPAFTWWGHVAAGGEPASPEVIRAGTAFELLHAFALVHDDVMDDADTRRGQPTPHVEYAAHHDLGGWKGESRRFGDSVAILVGDLAHSYAEAAILDLPAPARQVWSAMQIELMFGQYLDVVGTARGLVDARRSRLIARLKSGRYTIEHPLDLGAALAGAPEDGPVRAALAAYGEPLGVAFQLRDDVLGVFGDQSAVGKPVGGDLREGKPTPMLALAVDRADPAGRALLERVGTPGLTDDDIAAMVDVLERTGARDDIEDEIDRLVDRAVTVVGHAPVDTRAAEALVELAVYVAGRDR